MALQIVASTLFPTVIGAETLRVATWHVDLSRKGPGLLLRDILEDRDPEISTVVQEIARLKADVLLLSDIDFDHDLQALAALNARLAEHGAGFAHLFARRPNSGWPTGLDLDGDGRLGGPRDAQGFGYFNGQGGLALLSRLPLDTGEISDLSQLLWRDFPGSSMALDDVGADLQRLSSTAHWDVPVILSNGERLHVLAFHATPPVFDGPEDRNGRRNADELRLWQQYLNGALPQPPPGERFVLLGNANLDPLRGDGRRAAMRAFLADPRVQDPAPGSDTAHWPAPGPGTMRVSYALPSSALRVVAAGQGDPVGAHRPVWVDIDTDPGS
ncbi:endonuclease/exonuclease/phosphatase family protein [Puniceibacterium confluentis]|uniref:endonuclease/exonuclease/phosphatase family protein n=1 Tax=Puniceibacterium confluentis TaxID=1958944 RepID=UPI001FE299DE|nr:endonuclease/exonuclease/phosphatase family protein [Puniceibacterium confluentis]